METRRNDRVSWAAVISLALIFAPVAAVGQEGSPPTLAADQPAYLTSPYHGAVDGLGRKIPCLCRAQDRTYHLGETACLSTPAGIVLARCDLLLNNVSWVPTNIPCVMSDANPTTIIASAE